MSHDHHPSLALKRRLRLVRLALRLRLQRIRGRLELARFTELVPRREQWFDDGVAFFIFVSNSDRNPFSIYLLNDIVRREEILWTSGKGERRVRKMWRTCACLRAMCVRIPA